MAFDPGPLDDRPSTPEEEVAYRDQLQEVVAEKRAALDDPGPSWHEWFYFSAMKWYVALACMILDAWIVVSFLELGGNVGLFGGLGVFVGAVYLEFLLWRWLWARPTHERPVRAGFRPSWHTPVQFGRWTPEAELYRAGKVIPTGPDPNEFL